MSARNSSRENLMNIRKAVCRTIASRVPQLGGTVGVPPGWSCHLRVNGALSVSVVVGRASPASIARGQNQWRFGYRSQRKPDILIVARIDAGSTDVRDYFVLPFLFLPADAWLTVSGRNYRRLEGFRSRNALSVLRIMRSKESLWVMQMPDQREFSRARRCVAVEALAKEGRCRAGESFARWRCEGACVHGSAYFGRQGCFRALRHSQRSIGSSGIPGKSKFRHWADRRRGIARRESQRPLA